jgi:hypothetical protein
MIHWILGQFSALNYFTDQQGIMKRYLVEKDQWQPHLNRCKEFIIHSMPQYPKLNIAVLGSGWLLDVPISEMLLNHQVTLIDIHHPKQIWHKFRAYNNVSFVEKDLTYGLVSKARRSKSASEFFSFFEKTGPSDEFMQYDYVISINLLNQLDILLIDTIKKKFRATESQLWLLRKKIQDNHVLSLPKGKSTLITDWTELSFDDSCFLKGSQSLIYTDLLDRNEFKEWTWVFDTKKTYRKNNYTSFTVRATTI